MTHEYGKSRGRYIEQWVRLTNEDEKSFPEEGTFDRAFKYLRKGLNQPKSKAGPYQYAAFLNWYKKANKCEKECQMQSMKETHKRNTKLPTGWTELELVPVLLRFLLIYFPK